MKARTRYLSAASAVAMSTALVLPGAVVAELVTVSAAHAAVVRNIEVRGSAGIDASTVRSQIGIAPGQNVTSDEIDEAVKRLFATGLYSDVKINQSGSTLIVQVSEHQIVNQVLFQGNKKIKDAQLSNSVQTKPRSAFSSAQLESDAQTVKDAYAAVGRDDATVRTQVVDLGNNRVNVLFEINEGGRTKIAAVNFNGNNAYSDRRLAQVVSTKASGYLSFLFRDDIYSEDRLRADEEALRRFYFNRGYADFQVISATADLNEANNEYTINITVEEGERYRFGNISVESSIPEIDANSLNSVVETRSNDWYSAKDVEDTIIALTETVAGRGYAFAQVTPRGDRNFENHTIDVVYTIDQGQRAYVERIEIRGNDRTRDYVIRREFDISEGDAFNQVLIQRAKRRLEKLDYFQKVDVATAPGSQPDQVVLIVDVVEKSTGEFAVGAGYSTGGETSGPTIEGSITERNFLGRGQFIRISAGGGENSKDFMFSFTEPYFLGNRISAGFDIFRTTRRYSYYESQQTGGTIRFGLPITESISTQLAYTYSQEEYDYRDTCDANGDGIPDPSCLPNISQAVIQAIDESPWVRSSVSGTVVYDTIDDKKNPHEGLYGTFTTEYAGLGGDADYLKLTARGTAYKTLSEEMDIVGLASIGGGHISANGDDGLRIFDQFKSNNRIIRGFDYNGIGPYDANVDDPEENHLGGTTYLNASLEAQFPLPLVPEGLGMRGAVFADAATLYGSDIQVAGVNVQGDDMQWRASVGFGLLWASPFGPLRVDYAIPVAKEDYDQVQEFSFGVSTKF
ncbi:MAG: outer membrane protein assembly factor BamA [Rhizobiaceae bacterium]|nr:outer membrane protein assembly factor BamA [Rhizobiaceae bacterium]